MQVVVQLAEDSKANFADGICSPVDIYIKKFQPTFLVCERKERTKCPKQKFFQSAVPVQRVLYETGGGATSHRIVLHTMRFSPSAGPNTVSP